MREPGFYATHNSKIFWPLGLSPLLFLTMVEREKLGSLWSSQGTDARHLLLDKAAEPFSQQLPAL